MRRVAEDSRVYEGMFLVKNKPAKADPDGVAEEIGSYIKDAGATVVNSGKWDERKLAYDVAGERRGTYLLFHFEAGPDAVARIERACKISEIVLRALIVRDTDGIELPQQGGAVTKPEATPAGKESSEASGGEEGLKESRND